MRIVMQPRTRYMHILFADRGPATTTLNSLIVLLARTVEYPGTVQVLECTLCASVQGPLPSAAETRSIANAARIWGKLPARQSEFSTDFRSSRQFGSLQAASRCFFWYGNFN